MLNQTSGFSTATGRAMNVDFNIDDDALEQRVRGLSAVRLTQPVGAVYQYSNANYATLGLIVQALSGQPFERYLQEHILAPLEMNHSFTSKQAAQQQGLAMGHRFWFGIPAAYDEPFPRGRLRQGLALVMPLVLNLLWALLVLVWLSRTFAPLLALKLGAPGIGTTLLKSSLAALDWGSRALHWPSSHCAVRRPAPLMVPQLRSRHKKVPELLGNPCEASVTGRGRSAGQHITIIWGAKTSDDAHHL